MLELHVWGSQKSLAIIDADCLAATWYLALSLPSNEFKIITSSNTNLSTSGKLPVLRDSSTQIEGFISIVRYISNHGFDMDGFLDPSNRAINDGLVLYIQSNLQIITDYTLFLNKDNYEKYSRPVFGKYLSFPLQYNTPLHYRNLARENCCRIGLTTEDKTEIEQEMLKNIPTVSKVQQLSQESMIEEKLVMKNSITNMKCINKFKELIETLLELKREIGTIDDSNFFSTKITTSDLILVAHLDIVTNELLPDRFLNTFLNNFSPSLQTYKKRILEEINSRLLKCEIIGPAFSDSPNLINAIRYSMF